MDGWMDGWMEELFLILNSASCIAYIMTPVIFLKCIENNIICIFRGKTMHQWIIFFPQIVP